MASRTTDFQTIRSEGGLLPPDLLRRVLDPKGKLDGTRPEDYGLAPGERLNETVTQAWNRLRKHWTEFRSAAANLPPGEAGTGLTNDKWTLPLLRELGFGLLPTSAGPEIGGRTYAINRIFGRVPIHLVGCGLSLDRRAAGVRGAAAANPHGLVQEFLNRSGGHLWAIVSNGLKLRVLRDNQALSRQSFLEFDIDAMFDGEVFSDFVLLWLTVHATRFLPRESDRPETCWLEQWTKIASEQGTRALGDLRGGVEKALQILGEGFTAHPKNTALRDALRTGQVPLADFHGQLLRVVYRLIFLFVAEDRPIDGQPLLHPRDDSSAARVARERYAAHYSTARLREMAAAIKGSRHGDLWRQFQVVVRALSGDATTAAAREHLALPVLGSFLWDPGSTAVINEAELTNHDFLEALRHLAFTRQGKVLRPVDYRSLGAEELGGVYESLLALTPQISADGARFTFAEFAGNERKTSGSYYTPDSLVQCLLDSALDPVVEERLEEARRMASGEWRMVEEPYRRAFCDYANQRLPRLGSVAAGSGDRQSGVLADEAIPEGRTLRNDVADTSRGDVDTSQHRGGLGAPLPGGVRAVPAQGQRQPNRAGDAPDRERRREPLPRDSGSTPPAGTHRPGEATAGAGAESAAETELEALWIQIPFTIRHSLLAPTALLSLKVCDPAVGSGHFLVGAAHRLARHLARVRANAQGESEPSPLLYQHALRDVISRCLYGVDINPMAAELCRVSLWLEALEPGKPLSFLDHHIRIGNSLLGATPDLIAAGIPDEAFTPIEGDDKKACAILKKRNKAEREDLRPLFAEQDAEVQAHLQEAAAALDELPDDRPEDIRAKELAFRRHERTQQYRQKQKLADAWCAAFVIRKHFREPASESTGSGITQGHLNDLAEGRPLRDDLADETQRLAAQYQFFHWHLVFPEVSAKRGFDCLLGNPPWEMVELSEREFFAHRAPAIANAASARQRQALILRLEHDDPALWAQFREARRLVGGSRHFIQTNGRYARSSVGRINLYPLFTESVAHQLSPKGRAGIIVPSAISMDAYNAALFGWLLHNSRVVSLFDFENAGELFPSVHRSYRFCLLTLAGGDGHVGEIDFCYFAHSVDELRDPKRRVSLSRDDIRDFSPNTLAPPIFQQAEDKAIARRCYTRMAVFRDRREGKASAWGCAIQRMLSLSDEGDFFRRREDLPAVIPDDFERLYSGKTIHAFNHRFATFDAQDWRLATAQELSDPRFVPVTEYYVRREEVVSRLVDKWPSNWLIGYRDVARATDERTSIATIIPRVGCDTHCRNIYLGVADAGLAACLVSNINAFAFDYLARQKVIGTGIGAGLLEQLPVMPPAMYTVSCPWSGGSSQILKAWLCVRAFELMFTAWDLEPFGRDCGWSGPPFRWDEERRFLLRCELDAGFFHLYLSPDRDGAWSSVEGETAEHLARLKAAFPTPRDAAVYVMDTFPIVRRKDEERWDEYLTKRVILEIYDEMQASIRTGRRYETHLDPPPADPRCCHPEAER
jgi:hypothetical protein